MCQNVISAIGQASRLDYLFLPEFEFDRRMKNITLVIGSGLGLFHTAHGSRP